MQRAFLIPFRCGHLGLLLLSLLSSSFCTAYGIDRDNEIAPWRHSNASVGDHHIKYDEYHSTVLPFLRRTYEHVDVGMLKAKGMELIEQRLKGCRSFQEENLTKADWGKEGSKATGEASCARCSFCRRREG